ncbi:MAG: type 1 glutamine amidotransferase [Candidatus Omnitrophota bacterium]|nr:type 1 glutamine amidotransferase [Candidatus Omnitrophota bacterium]
MKPLLVIKNVTHEGPGLLEGILRDRVMTHEVVDLARGEKFPAPANYRGLVVLGGPDSANDRTEKMATELMRTRECIDQEIPYLGICLGLQVLVKAAGGGVVKSPLKEVGFREPDGKRFKVDLTGEGKADPLFDGLSDGFEVFQLHGETVRLTESMTLLAGGRHCRDQVVRVGTNAYGIQCHFELTREMLEVWASTDKDLRVLDKQKLLADFDAFSEIYTKTGKRLLENFLDKVIP